MTIPSPRRLSYRSDHIVLTTVALALLATASVRAERDPIRLTHGPMLGKPTAHSMAVWGRTSDAGQFTVHYGTHADRLDLVSMPATTTIDHDNTGVAQLTKLESDTRFGSTIDRTGCPEVFERCPVPTIHATRSTTPTVSSISGSKSDRAPTRTHFMAWATTRLRTRTSTGTGPTKFTSTS